MIRCYGNMADTVCVFKVTLCFFPLFQDGVDVSRAPGGDLLPLHLVVRRRRQRRPGLVSTDLPLLFPVCFNVFLPMVEPTSTILFFVFFLTGEILHL